MIIDRVLKAAVLPIVSRVINAGEAAWNSVPLERRAQLVRLLTFIFYPITLTTDYLRAGLVRLYVTNGRCATSVLSHSKALDSLVFKGKDKEVVTWDDRDASNKRTRAPALALVLFFTPVFYMSDIWRSWLCSVLFPEVEEAASQHLRAIWEITFGGSPRSG